MSFDPSFYDQTLNEKWAGMLSSSIPHSAVNINKVVESQLPAIMIVVKNIIIQIQGISVMCNKVQFTSFPNYKTDRVANFLQSRNKEISEAILKNYERDIYTIDTNLSSSFYGLYIYILYYFFIFFLFVVYFTNHYLLIVCYQQCIKGKRI